jgi:hypothetical protein
MAEPNNRLAGLLQRMEHLPEWMQECARDMAFTQVFSVFETREQLMRKRRSYRERGKIRKYGETHCARMILMIEGYLALREMGFAEYVKPRGRKRKKK